MERALYEMIIDRLDRIEDTGLKTFEQATKTNGKVLSLEENQKNLLKDVNQLKQKNAEIKGRDKTIWILIVAASIVIGYVIQHAISNHLK